MADRDSALRGLAEISEYMKARADVAGVGQVKDIFNGWYRAAEDARELLREQEPLAPEEMDVTPVSMKYYCGNCRCLVGFESAIHGAEKYRHVYCPKCGKKVEWDA
jgi:DNA-directed RNA polymerase subunit RPC12/RpoP